jgi:hypothetical protein
MSFFSGFPNGVSQPYPWVRDQGKGLQGCGPKRKPRVILHALGSARECEGIDLHTPKRTPTLGVGVPMDSWIFRAQF